MYTKGDIVIRIMQPDEKGASGAGAYKGVVTEVTKDTVECLIYVDVGRTMGFNSRTGVNVNGIDYGFIIPATSVDWMF